jgi:hypothetical protein
VGRAGGQVGRNGKRDRFAEHQPAGPARLQPVDVDGHAAAQRSADDVDVGAFEGVEDGDHVSGHAFVAVGLGRFGFVGAAVAPQVDADGPKAAGRRQSAGDRVEEPGAKSVGVKEYEGAGAGRATPVENGDAQAVVFDVQRAWLAIG